MICGAFAHHSEDAVPHLAEATWDAGEYECVDVELPSALPSLARARSWARRALRSSSLSPVEHGDVMLLVTELVTNAVVHARPGGAQTVIVRLAASEDRIRIEVSDRGGGFSPAAIRRPARDAPGGRGLFVIDAIASRWGTIRACRHCVWLERDR